MNEDIKFVEAFFRKLEENEIVYCILRNADEIEKGDAHDIDMTVDAKHLKETESILFSVADALGWKMHVKTGSASDKNNIKCYHLFSLKGGISIVHFDIFPTFTWKGLVMLDNIDLIEELDNSSVYHRASPVVEAITKLFIRLLHNGYVKDKYKQYIYEVFVTDKVKVNTSLCKFLSPTMSYKVYELVIQQEWKKLEDSKYVIVNDIKKTLKRRPEYHENIIGHKKYLIQKAISKTGLMIAFEGTDGSGKSTIINELPKVLGNTFPKDFIDYYHWRPGVIKKKKMIIDEEIICTDPHAKKPYTKLKSYAKFMFFNMDYILGYWWKVRWQLSKGHLVIFDRYYYDYYLDKIRYRLDINDDLLDFWKTFIPKPDITFLLVGDANILYERKKEIPLEEIEKQIVRILKNKRRFHNSVIIDVNQAIDTVVTDVSTKILMFATKI